MTQTRSSSAPSTPAGKANSALGATPTAPQSTPRKVPHCTKCHRPRAGHPRQGCPYVDSPAPAKVEKQITDALESLHIEPHDVKVIPQRRLGRSSVKPTPVPEASLESLTTDTSAILNGLLRPGMMDDYVDEDERRASVARWQNVIPILTKSKAPARMPGTLITPSDTKSSLAPDESISLPVNPADEETKPSFRIPRAIYTPSATKITVEPLSIDLVSTQEVSAASQDSSASSHELLRSLSLEQRHAFLNDLVTTSKAPPANVFVLPMEEIPAVQQLATKLGFHCRVHDLENGDGWLIIGMDGQAVESLFVGVEGGTKERKIASGGAFKAVVGGAIAGGVATWTGLAYA
jgi:hypothetical protein